MIACDTPALACGPILGEAARHELRCRMVFDWGKWDPQMEDHCALAPFPLVLSSRAYAELSSAAERLYAEALSAEVEIAARPDLHARLGLGWRLRRALHSADPQPTCPRIMRFDFHPVPAGWALSEVNSDVPGGILEASGLPECFAALSPTDGLSHPGRPADAIAAALAGLGTGGTVALVHATAYTDDRQVMRHLAAALVRRGVAAVLSAPDAIRWDRAGRAHTAGGQSLAATYRFFPVEWLPALGPRACEGYFRPGATAHMNPATAAFTQSKRFPLVWDDLETPLPTWRALLPETRDPRGAPRSEPGWVLKPAMGRVGEDVVIEGVTSADTAGRARRWARLLPGRWACQQRFEAVAVESPLGPVYPVLGVYVVAGHVSGVYARIAARPLIDKLAQDCALFIAREDRTC